MLKHRSLLNERLPLTVRVADAVKARRRPVQQLDALLELSQLGHQLRLADPEHPSLHGIARAVGEIALGEIQRALRSPEVPAGLPGTRESDQGGRAPVEPQLVDQADVG